MENISKKNISIFMIIGGVIVLAKYLMNLNDNANTNNYVIIICAIVFVVLGLVSLIRTTNKNKV